MKELRNSWVKREETYRSPSMSDRVIMSEENIRPGPFPTLWCEDGAGRERDHVTEEHSEPHLLVHRLLNHSFKATQLKSGSFRVTVDGVPKALDVLHKEKITCQLVKAVTKKDVGQVTRTSQKFQLAELKKTPKRTDQDPLTVQKHSGKVDPTSLVCVDVTHNK